eukprot:scaffold5793_cov105-Isochrysis_galbana.AAC.3
MRTRSTTRRPSRSTARGCVRRRQAAPAASRAQPHRRPLRLARSGRDYSPGGGHAAHHAADRGSGEAEGIRRDGAEEPRDQVQDRLHAQPDAPPAPGPQHRRPRPPAPWQDVPGRQPGRTDAPVGAGAARPPGQGGEARGGRAGHRATVHRLACRRAEARALDQGVASQPPAAVLDGEALSLQPDRYARPRQLPGRGDGGAPAGRRRAAGGGRGRGRHGQHRAAHPARAGRAAAHRALRQQDG